ncbi:hypothetical protein Barb4_02751 [Bacteroidales bacterium Barb4]|nr:hypothetical protein Barb4_02751 [Bacteroidales bacterium Barb4]
MTAKKAQTLTAGTSNNVPPHSWLCHLTPPAVSSHTAFRTDILFFP